MDLRTNEPKGVVKEDHPSPGWYTVYDQNGIFLGSFRSQVIARQIAMKGYPRK